MTLAGKWGWFLHGSDVSKSNGCWFKGPEVTSAGWEGLWVWFKVTGDSLQRRSDIDHHVQL